MNHSAHPLSHTEPFPDRPADAGAAFTGGTGGSRPVPRRLYHRLFQVHSPYVAWYNGESREWQHLTV